MIRTQIQLTEQQARALRTKARLEGLSMAEVIRQCIDRTLKDETHRRARLYGQASRLVGRFRDKRRARDLSEAHDKYFDEAQD